MFGVLGYGYEYLTGSDLGDDLVAGGQYVYDAGGQIVGDAQTYALETAGDIYDYGSRRLEELGRTVDEQSGFKTLRETTRDTLETIDRGTKKASNLVTYAAVGAGVVAAGLLALALGRRG
jgi:hypothetical protein